MQKATAWKWLGGAQKGFLLEQENQQKQAQKTQKVQILLLEERNTVEPFPKEIIESPKEHEGFISICAIAKKIESIITELDRLFMYLTSSVSMHFNIKRSREMHEREGNNSHAPTHIHLHNTFPVEAGPSQGKGVVTLNEVGDFTYMGLDKTITK